MIDDYLLAVGHRNIHANAEVFDASGWLAIDPYHFHPHINSAAIVHYQNAFYHIGGEIKDSPFQSNVIAKLDLVNFKWSQVGVLTHDRRRL